tara:strand:- start:245 stop:1219 length:975 start_codon:yes stop_codon:yes gene_type:complete
MPTVISRAGLASKILNFVEWNIRVIFFSLNYQPGCVNAHSLSSLPAAVAIKLLKRCSLIYEPHEIETETTETKGLRKLVSKFVERSLVKFVDKMLLTSRGHEEWYRRAFPTMSMFTTRNCPYWAQKGHPREEDSNIRAVLNLDGTDRLFLYHGAISFPRGVMTVARAFMRVRPSQHILFMGFGSAVDEIKEYARENRNIHYLPAVPPERVRFHAEQADVGIHMMDDSCVNHLYALPNKPMEYMNAGLAVIVSDVPEMAQLIIEARTGYTVPVGDEVALAELVDSLADTDLSTQRENARAWSMMNNWENEELKLLDFYRDLGGKF